MASYAAAIREKLKVDVKVETGSKGQFDVIVDGKTVVTVKADHSRW